MTYTFVLIFWIIGQSGANAVLARSREECQETLAAVKKAEPTLDGVCIKIMGVLE